MTDDLLSQVRSEFLPLVPSYALEVVHHDESSSFGDATVILQAGDLRLRIVRERSQLFADLGSAADPGSWFDSTVVMDCLNISSNAGLHGRDGAAVLKGLANFLNTFRDELLTTFSRSEFPRTKGALVSVRDARAAARFGP